jgi:capsular exopolysaccharide synthesis family protein
LPSFRICTTCPISHTDDDARTDQMSRIYDALKKLEAESQKSNGSSGNGTNGGSNGTNGGGRGRRRWRPWPFRRNAGTTQLAPTAIDFNLGPEVEEAYQRLGTNLLLAPGQLDASHPRLLGVVASRHGEGATTTAGVFASILVRRRGGRVVVVEGNLHSPSFETAFGVRPSPGLVDIIQGQATVAEAAQATSVPKLFAIAGGQPTVTPASLFDCPGLPAAFANLREQFDFAIVDLPPVNVYGDALIVGPHLDAAVIVIEADATRVSEVERARRTLERAGVRFVGSVLNRQRSYIPAFIEEML